MDEANALGGRSIALLALAGFASAASMRVCDPLLPKLAETFQATPGDAAHAISAFAIAYGLLQLVYGPLGDRYGKRRVIALATAACTLGAWGRQSHPPSAGSSLSECSPEGLPPPLSPSPWRGSVTLSHTLDASRHWHGC